ncbi:MAG: ribokinase [Verrucomicrobiaceae bacterium]|nr:ribokinase [Verrucomicrobiaceae bacterium]
MAHVTVLGSLTYDCISHVADFPRSGHTAVASDLTFRLGGRGGNQAVAAARHGSTVSLLGCVGDDSAGGEYLNALKMYGVEIDAIIQRPDVPTGMGMITVNARGESQTVLFPGANDSLKPSDLEMRQSFIARAAIFLCQLEMPMEVTLAALRLAPMMGTATCLNASPWRADFPWGEVELDYVIVNDAESRDLLSRAALHLGDGAWVLHKLEQLHIQTLIITRGPDSTLVFSRREGLMEIPTRQMSPLDAACAGDAFAGVFCARWAENRDFIRSLRAAGAAGTLTTQREGAMDSLPNREKVDAMLLELGYA